MGCEALTPEKTTSTWKFSTWGILNPYFTSCCYLRIVQKYVSSKTFTDFQILETICKDCVCSMPYLNQTQLLSKLCCLVLETQGWLLGCSIRTLCCCSTAGTHVQTYIHTSTSDAESRLSCSAEYLEASIHSAETSNWSRPPK